VKKIYDISTRLYDNYAVSAVRNGLLLVFPLIIIGTFAALFQNVMYGILPEQWERAFQFIYDISGGIVSAALTFSISYCMAGGTEKSSSGSVMPVIPAIVSLTCYFALTLDTSGDQSFYTMSGGGLPAAIISGLVSVWIFTLIYDCLKKRTLRSSPDTNRYVMQVLLSLIPAFTVVLIFLMLRYTAVKLGYNNINSVLSYWFASLFDKIGGVFSKLVLYVLLTNVLWFLGIHGNMMLGLAMKIIIDDTLYFEQIGIISAASASYSSGDLTMTFINVYTCIGGIGSTICLLAAILIASGKTGAERLAKISLLPALFNINEIVVFGLPIILNPIFLIPFMLCPIVTMLISYLAIISGLLPPVCQTVYWALPPLYNAYAASNSIMGPIVQLLCIAVGTLLYLPFVKLNEKIVADRSKSTYLALKKQIEEYRYGDRY
jgi:PTS system cellobiose-specific IIC component